MMTCIDLEGSGVSCNTTFALTRSRTSTQHKARRLSWLMATVLTTLVPNSSYRFSVGLSYARQVSSSLLALVNSKKKAIGRPKSLYSRSSKT